MTCRGALKFLLILFALVACVTEGRETLEVREKSSGTTEAQVTKPRQNGPEQEKIHAYVVDEILVKFVDGTSEETIEAIQEEVHLKTIRIVSRPNLYLMRITDGSTVEGVMKRLKNFSEVAYSEPNYIRTIR